MMPLPHIHIEDAGLTFRFVIAYQYFTSLLTASVSGPCIF
jgi:hypothetical protein